MMEALCHTETMESIYFIPSISSQRLNALQEGNVSGLSSREAVFLIKRRVARVWEESRLNQP